MEEHDINSLDQINSQHIRAFLGEMAARGCKDSYIHTYARAFKTFVRFLEQEGYISLSIKITLPKVVPSPLTVYDIDQIKQILLCCADNRDRAFINLMVDSGLRNAEARALNWADVDLASGIITVRCGKGRKHRMVMVGIKTRRVLLKYRTEINPADSDPLFQTNAGGRFTGSGLHSWMRRLSKRARIHITPHALRRTFATLSLRAGMNVFQLQGLLGHASLEMTRHYVTLIDKDLIDAHQKHGPVDHLLI
ncbi:MAG TPA: tyrosine-type recombinase/integrase [Brevefilum sp.]|nr:tyrosine-type recombinase/integrase [Brevefilum sp.]